MWRSFFCTRENSCLTLPHCKGYSFCPQWNGWDWSQKAEWIVNPVKRHFLWSLACIHMSVCKEYIYFRQKPYFYLTGFTSELRFECLSLILVLNEENHPFIKIFSLSFYTYCISTPSSLPFLVKQSQKKMISIFIITTNNKFVLMVLSSVASLLSFQYYFLCNKDCQELKTTD